MILLADTQICENTDEQLRTFFFGWCLLCGGMVLCVFVACTDSECADAQILTLFWLALEICGGVQRRLVPSPQVSELSQSGVHHSTMPPKVAAARRGQGSRVGPRHPANKVAAAKNSL